jgi:RimJ/RimL family protein N-acetyltransferase
MIFIYNIKELIKKINSDEKYKLFFEEYKKKYLEEMSNKFKKMNVIQILKSEKSYFLKNKGKRFILIYENNNIPIAICKVIYFNKISKDISFFDKLKEKYNKFENIFYIYGLYVSEISRKKGICSKLLDAIILISKNNNINYLVSDISQDNIGSIKCFEKNGFINTNILNDRKHIKQSFFILQK